MANKFSPQTFVDHEIVAGDGKLIGTIRIKPSGVLWAPRSAKQWYRLTLAKFAKLIEQNGTQQKK
ncbi:MAG: hypothetical protein M5U15_00815 [Kiritimatiellae bacterium]|nr:hypothetical protein [Kiritimatiellia bacterium]